jgi:hypothetical protein
MHTELLEPGRGDRSAHVAARFAFFDSLAPVEADPTVGVRLRAVDEVEQLLVTAG